MPTRRDEQHSPATTPRNSVETPPPPRSRGSLNAAGDAASASRRPSSGDANRKVKKAGRSSGIWCGSTSTASGEDVRAVAPQFSRFGQ